MSLILYNFSGILSNYRIRIAKTRLNSFLEEARSLAISKGSNVRVYYNAITKRIMDSEGGELLDHHAASSIGFVLRYNPDGSIFIEEGFATLTYDDLSALTILPVTGRVVY